MQHKTPGWCWIVIFIGLFILGCFGYIRLVEGRLEDFKNYVHPVIIDPTEYSFTRGKASWYDYSLSGYPNYSKENYTAASRDYPRGTKLRVCRIEINITRLKNGKWQNWPCVEIRVNDYVENPDVVIDLSSRAFQKLGSLSKGIIEVEITKL